MDSLSRIISLSCRFVNGNSNSRPFDPKKWIVFSKDLHGFHLSLTIPNLELKAGLRVFGKEVGFGPITEILLYRDTGLRLVGPLPVEVQNYTPYKAVPMKTGANPEDARALIRYLGGPAAKALFVAAGIE